MLSSIFYSISYAAAYKRGDNYVMDKIDEIIINEDKHDAFMNGENSTSKRGFRIYGHRPTSQEAREKVFATMMDEDEESLVS